MRIRARDIGLPLLCIVGLLCTPASATASLYSASSIPARGEDRFVGTPTQIPVDDEFDIHFSNPKLANTEVSILIFDGKREATVKIKLDKNGKGTRKWRSPPGWVSAILTHQTSNDHGIIFGV